MKTLTKYLIPMTDFVLKQKETSTFDTEQLDWFWMEVNKLDRIRSYAKFLKLKPTLEMFVPCIDGVPIEKPNSCSKPCSPSDWSDTGKCSDCKKQVEAYEAAQSKVLFADFECVAKDGIRSVGKVKYYVLTNKDVSITIQPEYMTVFGLRMDITHVEDLASLNLTLTQSALDIINSNH